jgi:hypothetical protein
MWSGAGALRQSTRGLILLALLAGSACTTVSPPANGHATPEDLAESILKALEADDRASLQRFALSEEEFRNHVWPALPAARPERNLPFSYVWGDLAQKSAASLDATMSRHGGQRYELVQLTFASETQYGTYRVMRDATFHVRTSEGATEDLRITGSFITNGGQWKVFSYVVDP